MKMKFFRVLLMTLVIFMLIPSYTYAFSSEDAISEIRIEEFEIYEISEKGDLIPTGYDDELNGRYFLAKTITADNGYRMRLVINCYVRYGTIETIEFSNLETGSKGFIGTLEVYKVSRNILNYYISGTLYNNSTTTYGVTGGYNGESFSINFNASNSSSHYTNLSSSFGSISLADRVIW